MSLVAAMLPRQANKSKAEVVAGAEGNLGHSGGEGVIVEGADRGRV